MTRFTGRRGWAAAFALLTAVLFVASASSPAFAETPHVSASVDTASCAACHSTHTAAHSLLLRGSDASSTLSDSCLACHNGSDDEASNVATGQLDAFDLPSGHSLTSETSVTASISGCDTCHETHGASDEARRIPADEVNGGSVSSADKQLCIACHTAGEDWFGPGYPSTSLPTRDATGYPVAGTWPGPSTYESEANAHRLIPESTVTVGVSEPIRRDQGSCLYCHAAHGGANAYDGLLTTYTVPSQATLASDTADGSYAALCFECHGGTRPSGFAETPVDIKQFATASGGTGGHTIITSGGILPVGAPLPCFECHNPHGSKRDNGSLLSDERGASLGTTSPAGVRAFCFTCHATSDTASGWDSETATYTVVTSADEIVGLPRDGALLRLPASVGHSQEDTTSCYECHGDDYGDDGHNVHNPIDGHAGRFAVAVEPLASVLTTDAVEASGSVDASASLDASASIAATDSILPSDTVGILELPSPPSEADTGTIVPMDLIPPLTHSDAVATYSVSATITLTAEDDFGGSGVAETYWSLDGGTLSTGTVIATSAVGPHSLSYWSVDAAGNVESATTVDFQIDAPQAMSFLPALAARRSWAISGAST